MRMCTLPQGTTNSMARMQNAMNQILRDFVPEYTTPFVDDLYIKGSKVEARDLTTNDASCKMFYKRPHYRCGKDFNKA